jgi:SepF-like predicted cell division protein (DUF552 family)
MYVEMEDDSPIKLGRQLRDLVVRTPRIINQQPKLKIIVPPKVVKVEREILSPN